MVSAGLDTVPSNLIMLIALLSSPSHAHIQSTAYSAILAAYPSNTAWRACLLEEKIPYITALVKETLRWATVIPICLPRLSVKPVGYGGAVIPEGTTLYMNAYAADYDDAHFTDPYAFDPERYLGGGAAEGTPHYGYGAGSRMCAGSHLANRELFTAFVRLISAFEFFPSKLEKDRPVLDSLGANALPTSLTMEPKRFKVGIKVRDRELLEGWMAESERATRGLF
jgi:phenylacetate 2-hydroxylase